MYLRFRISNKYLHVFIVFHIRANLINFDFILLTKSGDKKGNSYIDAIEREIPIFEQWLSGGKLRDGSLHQNLNVHLYVCVCMYMRVS